jgi:hypothetical protein
MKMPEFERLTQLYIAIRMRQENKRVREIAAIC